MIKHIQNNTPVNNFHLKADTHKKYPIYFPPSELFFDSEVYCLGMSIDSNIESRFEISIFPKLKIGYSNSITARIKQLQTGNPYPLVLLDAICNDNINENMILEKEIKLMLPESSFEKHSRDWFNITSKLDISYIINYFLREIEDEENSFSESLFSFYFL